MEQDETKNGTEKQDLEKKVGFWGRTKYMAAPAALTVISGFVPEIKKKYNSLPQEKKETYTTLALAATTILGSVMALASGYNLIKDNKKEVMKEIA